MDKHAASPDMTEQGTVNPVRDQGNGGLGKAILASCLMGGFCLAALAVSLNWPRIRARYYVYRLCSASDYESHARLSGLLVEIGRPAVPALVAALEDNDGPTREHAAMALGEIGDPRAVGPLIASLEDSSRMVRARAAMALGEIKDPRSIAPLLRLLRDKESRDAASAALVFHDELAIVPLLRSLNDKDSSARAFALHALEEIVTDGQHGMTPSPFKLQLSATGEERRAQIAKIEAFFRLRRPEAFLHVAEPCSRE